MRVVNNIKVVIISLCLLSMLSACGGQKKWFRDRSNDYQDAESYPTIKIPSGVNAESFSSEYRIPGH